MVNTVEKIEYINCKLNGTNPNCTSSIRVESWDKNFAIRMNKSNNNLQQKLQSPSGPLTAVWKVEIRYKAMGLLETNKHAEYQAEGSPNYR